MFGFLLSYFMIFVLLFPCFLPGQSSFFFYFLFPLSPHWFGKCMFIQFYSFSKILLCIRALTKSRAVTSFFSTIRLLLPSPLLILGAFVVWYYGSIFFFFFSDFRFVVIIVIILCKHCLLIFASVFANSFVYLFFLHFRCGFNFLLPEVPSLVVFSPPRKDC